MVLLILQKGVACVECDRQGMTMFTFPSDLVIFLGPRMLLPEQRALIMSENQIISCDTHVYCQLNLQDIVVNSASTPNLIASYTSI